MGLSEVAYRGQQEAAKLIERLVPSRSRAHPEARLEETAPLLARPDAALCWLRDTAPSRFFAGVDDRRALAVLCQRWPDAARDLIADATNVIVERSFDLLGYQRLSFGDPIDWQLDPVWKRRSPVVHWSQIDPLDTAAVGDSKVVWELNRHQWIVRLAQAWTLTGDERYADAAVGSIDAWLDANPTGAGINWTSSLEVALRLMSWTWTLLLIRSLPSLSGEWVMKVVAAIGAHAAHVRRYLSYYFSPNTHLTGEALGLFYAGVVLREFHDAAKWRELGVGILIAESQRQISSDGVHFEQSTAYQRYTIDIYLHLLALARRNHVAIPPAVAESVGGMVDFLLAVRQPDGSVPAIGDADGGALLPLSRRSPDDASTLFSTAAVMFARPEFAWAARGVATDVPWLLGVDGVRTFEALRPAAPAGPASRVFPAGGYAVMRNGWEAAAHQLIVDIGPLGCPVSAGHGHADLLSIQAAIFGEPVLVDAGNYCYTTESEWRDYFRTTGAHNTVTVDGASQAQPAGPFGWRSRPRVRVREWHSTPELDFLDAEHDAFRSGDDAVVHRRRVLFVKPGYWLVVDDLMGAAQHQVTLAFQFAPMPVTLGPNRWARAQTPKGHALWVGPFTSGPLKIALHSGGLHPIRGWVAPDYGRQVAAPMLTCSMTATFPCRILTLLLPDAQASTSPPAVRLIYDAQGLPAGVFFERTGESVRVDERAVLVERE